MAETGERSLAVVITCEATAKSRKLTLPNKFGKLASWDLMTAATLA